MRTCPKCRQERVESVFVGKIQFYNKKYPETVGWCRHCAKARHTRYSKPALIRKRRMIASGAPDGELPSGWRTQINTLCGNRCLNCGSEERLAIDHIIPLVHQGRTALNNLQTLCCSCNAKKSTKSIDYRGPLFWKDPALREHWNIPPIEYSLDGKENIVIAYENPKEYDILKRMSFHA